MAGMQASDVRRAHVTLERYLCIRRLTCPTHVRHVGHVKKDHPFGVDKRASLMYLGRCKCK